MARHLGRICEASNIRVSPTREVGRTAILGCSWLSVNDVKTPYGEESVTEVSGLGHVVFFSPFALPGSICLYGPFDGRIELNATTVAGGLEKDKITESRRVR